jgi:hypothetical protein
MVTSNTVSQTVFNVGKIIDRAFGRCRLAPQQITAEYLSIAQDLLYLILSRLANKGIPLWSIQKVILPIYDAVQSVPCPLGTIDVLNSNLRTSNRLSGTYSSSQGIAGNAFDGNLSTACVQTTPGGYLQIQFPGPTQCPIYGILPNATGTWNIAIETSLDGITWTSIYTNTALPVVAGQWFWVDIEGVPESGVNYVRLQANGTTILNVTEFVQENLPEEIPIAKINRDDYANLPDKWFLGRPVQYWYDKQIDQPIITLWPAPQFQFTFNQLVLYVQQYIQDVGSLTQALWIPQRWFMAIVCELSRVLNVEIPEAQGDPTQLSLDATNELNDAWASETDGAPTMLRPNIWPYTR